MNTSDKAKGNAGFDLDNNKPTRCKACALTKEEYNHSPETMRQLEVIQERIGDNTLSFGCIVKNLSHHKYNEGIFLYEGPQKDHILSLDGKGMAGYFNFDVYGHPVMIGDVLDYLEENNEWLIKRNNPAFTTFNWRIEEAYQEVINQWKNKRKSINEQSTLCIEYIYTKVKPKGEL